MEENRDRIVIGIGAGSLVIGMFLPWITTIVPLTGEITKPGYRETFGIISGAIGILMFVLAIASSNPSKIKSIGVVVLGLLAGFMPYLNMEALKINAQITDALGGDSSIYEDFLPGAGVYLTYLGGLLVIVGGVLTWVASSQANIIAED